MWQFIVALEGISDACRHFNIPVVSGNVSFYNETNNLSIYPTPVLGMVGLIEPAHFTTTQWFKHAGDQIILLGETKEDLGGTEYLKLIHFREQGTPPWLDLDQEQALHHTLLSSIHQGLIQSAHDCSEGGLAVTLGECCVSHPSQSLGATIQLNLERSRLDALLFGESPSRAVVTTTPNHADSVLRIAQKHGISAAVIGEVGGDSLNISVLSDAKSNVCELKLTVETLQDTWGNSFERLVEQ